MVAKYSDLDLAAVKRQLIQWADELGFQALGVTDVALGEHETHLKRWLAAGYHGDLDYMAKHGDKRSRPDALLPGTVRVISARMNYMGDIAAAEQCLGDSQRAYISRYALGRDYHKVLRKRLAQLARRLEETIGPYQYRAFVDSAPVLEKALAEKAGLGWIGKNTLLLNRYAGSYFFLGEIYTDLPLPLDNAHSSDHCGSCSACLVACPTEAFVGPRQLDARRCIAYLTIEYKGVIPEPLRKAMGNRVFGCDDCQLVCPWNRFAQVSTEEDFQPRHGLDNAGLLALFLWDEATYLQRTEGSAMRRIGYEGWQRNLAVGLGNAPFQPAIVQALEARRADASDMVKQHIDWALRQQREQSARIPTASD